ncbi:hypothetical protein COCNU_01G016580 [Cocos nucifera]|uniref:Uncharacterized protein n=1 Tax=Cocos nucifera TaxID=13894 RepID=A0A8K0HX07_COCNU|nr:hypothetical protein COCNU_01G016580 [Cocos nucifera]
MAGGVGDDKNKKRAAIAKVVRKAHLGGLSDNGGDDLGTDPFGNPEIIRDLIDKFIMPEEVDRLADLGQMQFILEYLGTFLKVVEALRVQGDLQTEVDSLQGKVTEVELLVEEKVVENENL